MNYRHILHFTFLTCAESDNILVYPQEYLRKGEQLPVCILFKYCLTVKHLLIEYVDFNDVRLKFDEVPSLQDICKTVKADVMG